VHTEPAPQAHRRGGRCGNRSTVSSSKPTYYARSTSRRDTCRRPTALCRDSALAFLMASAAARTWPMPPAMYSRCSCRTRIVIAFAALVGAAPLAGAAGAVHSFAALVGAEPFAAAACAIVVATVAAPKLGATGIGGGAPSHRGAFSPIAGVVVVVVCAALAAQPPTRGVDSVAPPKMNVAGLMRTFETAPSFAAPGIVGAAPKLGAVVCGGRGEGEAGARGGGGEGAARCGGGGGAARCGGGGGEYAA